MDALQILDNAIAQINSLRNASLFQGKDAIQGGEKVKGIAMNALLKIKARQSSIENLKRISFGNEDACRYMVSLDGYGSMMSSLNNTYQAGVQMVINLLQQERDLRAEQMENKRLDMSLKYSRIAIAISILSLLVALFK